MFPKSILVIVLLIVNLATSRASSLEPEIVRQDRKYFVLFPGGMKVEIVKEHEGGALNAAVLSPDQKWVFYTDMADIGFESSGKELFYCKSDGTERTFLRKVGGAVVNVNWIQEDGHNYILFREVFAGLGWGTLDLFDFDNRKVILRIKDWGLERIEDTDCFTIIEYKGKPEAGSKICLDSLLALSTPDKYNVEIYGSYYRPDLFYLSCRREPFLDPSLMWYDGNDDEWIRKSYGGIGHHSTSHDNRRTAYWINRESNSWIGVLNKNTNSFQYTDSLSTGTFGDNFVWSDYGSFLGFVRRYPAGYQEIVVLEFLDDSSCAVRQNTRLMEEELIELTGWSTRKGGFHYMVGKKEFLKVME
jgi:hypothetical protein